MRSRGYLGRAYVTSGNILYKTKYLPGNLWEEIIFSSKRVQRVLSRRIIENKAEARDSDVAMALLTGDKQLLDSNIREQYSKAGVSHVLAISGLHLGIIFLFLNFFLSPLLFVRRGKIIRTILIIFILWTYCFITGLSPSVMRSAFMLSLMQISFLTTRNYNSYNALFSSAFVLILMNPYFIYDISFQMSYLAIFTILFFFPRLRRWSRAEKAENWILSKSKEYKGFKRVGWLGMRRGFQFITGVLLVGVSAQIGVTPITGYFFGIFPLLNIFVNPVIMVLMMQIIFMGFIYLLIFDTPAGDMVGELFSGLISALNEVVQWTSSFKYASIEYGNLSLAGLYISYAVIVSLMIIIKWSEYRKSRLANV
ncbi:MAG: ComEC/Rec2 family competence protein [Rikenellaceae bacterium]|nr:ComEC/Rec2 family competence protein [Rikenellaceae bacterium]